MATAVGVYARRTVEAGWLLALIVTPLLFSPETANAFELTKAAALRSIVAVLGAAWLVMALHGGGAEVGPAKAGLARREWMGMPLVVPALLIVAVAVSSTVLSIAPRVSLWGSYERVQGLYTTVCYVVLFFSIVAFLRRRDQVERAVTAILVVSLPVALYGLVQGHCVDPVPWQEYGAAAARSASTMGNPIFLAAFLIMCVPVAADRVIGACQAALMAPRLTASTLGLTACSGVVLIAQLAAIVYSQSRGPWLGLLAGMYLFVLLRLVLSRLQAADPAPLTGREAARAIAYAVGSVLVGILPAFVVSAVRGRRVRWLWLAWCAVGAILVAFLVVVNLPRGSAGPLSESRYGRLFNLVETGHGTGQVRLAIWGTAARVMGSHTPVWSPTGGHDRLDALRPLLGYGPETLTAVYTPLLPADFVTLQPPETLVDRSHNEAFDVLLQTGLLGLLTYLVFVTTAFSAGLGWLGLIDTRGARTAFLGLWFGCGALAGLAVRVVDGSWRLLGVTLPAGMLVGMAVYVVGTAWRRPGRARPAAHPHEGLLIALLSAMAAHFIESQFGIATVSTRTYFWSYAALLVAAGCASPPRQPDGSPESPAPADGRPDTQGPQSTHGPIDGPTAGVGGVLTVLVIAGFVLLTLAWEFLPVVLHRGGNATLLWLLLVTGIVTAGLIVCDDGTPSRAVLEDRRGRRRALLIAVGFVLAGLALGATPSIHGPLLYFVAMLVTMAVLAGPGAAPDAAPARSLLRPRAAVGVLAVGAALGVVWLAGLRPVQADAYFRQAWTRHQLPGQLDAAIALYENAVALAPSQPGYYPGLATALLDRTAGPAAPPPRSPWEIELRARTEAALRRARELDPFRPGHSRNLGRFHELQALGASAAGERQEALARSLASYDDALRLNPNAASRYNDRARIYLLMGRFDRALAAYRQAITLDPALPDGYVGLREAYRARARTAADEGARQADLAGADEATRKAMELTARSASLARSSGPCSGPSPRG